MQQLQTPTILQTQNYLYCLCVYMKGDAEKSTKSHCKTAMEVKEKVNFQEEK